MKLNNFQSVKIFRERNFQTLIIEIVNRRNSKILRLMLKILDGTIQFTNEKVLRFNVYSFYSKSKLLTTCIQIYFLNNKFSQVLLLIFGLSFEYTNIKYVSPSPTADVNLTCTNLSPMPPALTSGVFAFS